MIESHKNTPDDILLRAPELQPAIIDELIPKRQKPGAKLIILNQIEQADHMSKLELSEATGYSNHHIGINVRWLEAVSLSESTEHEKPALYSITKLGRTAMDQVRVNKAELFTAEGTLLEPSYSLRSAASFNIIDMVLHEASSVSSDGTVWLRQNGDSGGAVDEVAEFVGSTRDTVTRRLYDLNTRNLVDITKRESRKRGSVATNIGVTVSGQKWHSERLSDLGASDWTDKSYQIDEILELQEGLSHLGSSGINLLTDITGLTAMTLSELSAHQQFLKEKFEAIRAGVLPQKRR